MDGCAEMGPERGIMEGCAEMGPERGIMEGCAEMGPERGIMESYAEMGPERDLKITLPCYALKGGRCVLNTLKLFTGSRQMHRAAAGNVYAQLVNC